MKKFLINILLIITFLIIYLLQINFFGFFKIARYNAEFNSNVCFIY